MQVIVRQDMSELMLVEMLKELRLPFLSAETVPAVVNVVFMVAEC